MMTLDIIQLHDASIVDVYRVTRDQVLSRDAASICRQCGHTN